MPVSSASQDFGVMLLHHLVAILLITFSYVNNMARVGTLILCLHDSADALLEVKVFFSYIRVQNLKFKESLRSSVLLGYARWCWEKVVYNFFESAECFSVGLTGESKILIYKFVCKNYSPS